MKCQFFHGRNIDLVVLKTQTKVECTCSARKCTLQHTQCTCSIGCAVYVQPTFCVYCSYTETTLYTPLRSGKALEVIHLRSCGQEGVKNATSHVTEIVPMSRGKEVARRFLWWGPGVTLTIARTAPLMSCVCTKRILHMVTGPH